MVSDEEALRLDRAEKRRRVVRTLRTTVLVVMLLAVAVGAMAVWMASRREIYEGPWCVWATPTGGTTTVALAPGTTTAAPTYGDVRVAPGGDTAPGAWSSASFPMPTPASGQRVVAMLYDFGARSAWSIFAGDGWMPCYYESAVQRTSSDGKVWTAFLLHSVAPGATIAPAPDPRCAGTWEFTDDDATGTAKRPARLELLASGKVRGAGAGSVWAVRDGVLVIQNSDGHDSRYGASQPGWQYVGVLSDDVQSLAGMRASVMPIHGTRTGK